MLDSGSGTFTVPRFFVQVSRLFRTARMLARCAVSTNRPILAHIVPTRRCNLACQYCNEYDNHSAPVSTAAMLARVDRLAELGTGIVAASGGEPLLHPDLYSIISRVRQRGMIAGLITNGYLLTESRISGLNRAGLDHMQISVDNINPDDVSKKSLRVLDRKLQLLAEYADFEVTINAVLGGGIGNPWDALTVHARAVELGFAATVGVIHDGRGQVGGLTGVERAVYQSIKGLRRLGGGTGGYVGLGGFQDSIVYGQSVDWQCRSGARYLYVCENGLVHYCSQQIGYPGIPLAEYSKTDLRREFLTEKACAPNCTVTCAHYVAAMDSWRGKQAVKDPRGGSGLVQVQGARG